MERGQAVAERLTPFAVTAERQEKFADQSLHGVAELQLEPITKKVVETPAGTNDRYARRHGAAIAAKTSERLFAYQTI